MPALNRFLAGASAMLIVLANAASAFARDEGQWSNTDPALLEWYETLMQPDNPKVSCCGEADAYWADELHVRDGKTFATITDDRPDRPLHRPHVDLGTEIEIPNAKLKHDQGNPTGHGVLFMDRGGDVLCYVMPGGV